MGLSTRPLSAARTNIQSPKLQVQESWMGNQWDGSELRDLVGEDKIEEIISLKVSYKDGSDRFIWKTNMEGKFLIASAWEITRSRRDH